jgi:Na+-translocating ferredoxin:NAD+ oxidoreductase RnfG subunit
MESIINSLSKDPLYLILTIFTAVSSIILTILYIIEKRIEKKIKEKKQKRIYKEESNLIEHENQ